MTTYSDNGTTQLLTQDKFCNGKFNFSAVAHLKDKFGNVFIVFIIFTCLIYIAVSMGKFIW
jgi:hypothetical protein